MDPLRAAATSLALATSLAIATPSARAAGTSWLCGLSEEGTRLVCIADVQVAEIESGPAPATAMVNGTRFPLDPAQIYTVEMWTPPTDPEWVQLLARSTICYRSPGCEVTMATGPVWRGMVALAGRSRR